MYVLHSVPSRAITVRDYGWTSVCYALSFFSVHTIAKVTAEKWLVTKFIGANQALQALGSGTVSVRCKRWPIANSNLTKASLLTNGWSLLFDIAKQYKLLVLCQWTHNVSMDLRLTGSSNCAKAWTVWFKKLNFCTKANTLKLNPIVFPVPRTTHSCFHKCPFVKLTDHVDPEYQKSFPPPSSLPTVYPIFTLGILFFFLHITIMAGWPCVIMMVVGGTSRACFCCVSKWIKLHIAAGY